MRLVYFLSFTFLIYLMYKIFGFDIMVCVALGTIIGEQVFLAKNKN